MYYVSPDYMSFFFCYIYKKGILWLLYYFFKDNSFFFPICNKYFSFVDVKENDSFSIRAKNFK